MRNLEIGGIDLRRIAARWGTPLIVYDEAKIDNQLNKALSGFSSEMFQTEVVYAAKAFSCMEIFRKAKEHGAGLDVVSGGELYLAYKSGFPMEKVYFHGNNKSDEELEMALLKGTGTIVLDNMAECSRLSQLCEELNKKIDVLLRINCGIEAHTHEYIRTTGADSKFGVMIDDTDTITEIIRTAEKTPQMTFRGFHSHIGSQITDSAAFYEAAAVMISFLSEIQKKTDTEIDTLSLGGGFGIKYTDKEEETDLGKMVEDLKAACEKEAAIYPQRLKRLIIEPGRSIVGEAGYSVYTVGCSKKTETKNFLFVDGGMSDNIRPALYQAEYSCDIAGRMDEEKNTAYCIAGKNCESGDILIKEAMLPEKIVMGDLLVMYSTGAYGYSMASNYNRAGRPAVVFVKDGGARLVLRRETYDDMMALETDERLDN